MRVLQSTHNITQPYPPAQTLMSRTTVDNLVEQLRCHRLLSPTQLEELERVAVPGCSEARDLAEQLVKRRTLNAFQAEQLVQGKDLVLDDYLLLGKLGEGGMGIVYKARHRLMGRDVALKLVHHERLVGPQSRERFLREIRSLGQLSHPNVVTAFDAGQVDDRCFLVMELLEGMNLAQLVRASGPLPAEVACHYIRQAALGLAHAHQRGVIHRDIKPSNLLRTPDDIIKILDLGLAQLCVDGDGSTVDPLTPAGTGMGTPDFIAPEQARDSQQADPRSDLYSLGCTLYCLLAGSVPFPGGSATSKLLRHQTDTPAPLEEKRADVPTAVAAVVRKMMARQPEDRYQTAAEVVAALSVPNLLPETGPHRFLIQAPVVAATPSSAASTEQHRASTEPTQVDMRLGRRRFALPALLIVLSLLGSASGLFWWLKAHPAGQDQSAGLQQPAAEPPPKVPPPEVPPHLLHLCEGHHGWVKAVAFLPPQGQTLISGGSDGFRLWNVESGRQLPGVTVEGIIKLAVSPDGSHIALATQKLPATLVLWDAVAGVQTTDAPAPQFPARGLAFSPSGHQLVAIGFDNGVHVYETSRRQHVHRFKIDGGEVLGVCYLPDGQRIRTARKDEGPAFGPGLTIQTWDVQKEVETERKSFLIKNASCVAFSPDGERFLAAAADHSLVLGDIATGTEIKRLRGHTALVRSLALSADGKRALSGGGEREPPHPPEDCTVRLWDLNKGKEIYRSDPLRSPVAAVQFSPDGNVAAAGTDNKKVYLWQLPPPR
jgi:serine/threonine protein kinase